MSEHGLEYSVPLILDRLVRERIMEDLSWHNDQSPSFGYASPDDPDLALHLWVEHPLKEYRISNEAKRYMVTQGYEPGEEFDELSDALLHYFAKRRDIIPHIKPERGGPIRRWRPSGTRKQQRQPVDRFERVLDEFEGDIEAMYRHYIEKLSE